MYTYFGRSFWPGSYLTLVRAAKDVLVWGSISSVQQKIGGLIFIDSVQFKSIECLIVLII